MTSWRSGEKATEHLQGPCCMTIWGFTKNVVKAVILASQSSQDGRIWGLVLAMLLFVSEFHPSVFHLGHVGEGPAMYYASAWEARNRELGRYFVPFVTLGVFPIVGLGLLVLKERGGGHS